MDPMVYKVGRFMTFTAQLNGLETGLVGEHEYVFPTATVDAYYLWKNVNNNARGPYLLPHLYLNSGFNNWYYPRHYRRNVFIRSSTFNNSHRINSTRASAAKNNHKSVNVKRIER
jgi:outer membrane lipoprotein